MTPRASSRFFGMVAVALVLAGMVASSGRQAVAGDLSASDLAIYRAAFRYANEENWAEATAYAAKARERLPAKVIRWMDLARPKSGHSHAEIVAFIRANPTWPNQTGLLRQAEDTMPPEVPPAEAAAWFDEHGPVSAAGFFGW